MTPTSPGYAGDSESLQADVMRFMAIIAFCLIAILALVRNVEPAEPTETTAAAVAPTATPAAPPPVTPTLPPAPAKQAAPRPEPEPKPMTEVMPAQPEPQPIPQRPEPVSQQASERSTPPPPETTPSPPAAAPTEEAGLILRFASDGDFLRLIARGDITVYAFQAEDVLSLSAGYRFLESPAPGQVYELLPPSIPSLVLNALREARPEIQGFRWGIALPGRISNQIEQHLDRVSQGELVIDRYGDVHHVAAS